MSQKMWPMDRFIKKFSAVLIPGVLLNALTKKQLETFQLTKPGFSPTEGLRTITQKAETSSHLTVVSRETLTNPCKLSAQLASSTLSGSRTQPGDGAATFRVGLYLN